MNTRSSHRALAALVSAGLGLSSSGCSFMFHTGLDVEPKKVDSTTELDCTKHPVLPILDTLNATGNLVNVGMAAGEVGIYKDQAISKEAAIGLNLAFFALYGASAIWGYHEMSQCREAHRRKSSYEMASEDEAPARETWSADADDGAMRPPPPKEVVGFAFGASVEEAAAACREAGYQWSDADGETRCDGAPLGDVKGASARLEFKEGRLAVVELVIRPPGEAPAWAQAIRGTEEALVQLYGKPHQRSFVVPAECRAVESFLGCVADGRVAGSASWAPGDGQTVALSIVGAPAPSTLRVRFAGKPAAP